MSGPIFDNFTTTQISDPAGPAITVPPDPSFGPPSDRDIYGFFIRGGRLSTIPVDELIGIGSLSYTYLSPEDFSNIGTVVLNDVSVRTEDKVFIALDLFMLDGGPIRIQQELETGNNQIITFNLNLPNLSSIKSLQIIVNTLPFDDFSAGSLSSTLRAPQGPGPQLTLQPSTLDIGEVGEDYRQELTLINANGQTLPSEITLFEGQLPPGLQLINGVIEGEPEQSGRFTLTIRAIDDDGFILFQDYTLLVLVDDDDQIEFDTDELPSGTETIPYTATVNINGSDDPLFFRVDQGSLPPSVILRTNPDGEGFTIRGTVKSGFAGQYTFIVIAQNLEGEILGLQEYTLIIAVVCIGRGSQVQMSDDSLKCIEEIKRGDEVKGNDKVYRVARLLVQKVSPEQSLSLVKFTQGCLGQNQPDRDLIMTSNHPLVEKDCRRPAHCYQNLIGVIFYDEIKSKDILKSCEDGSYELYDLQFETEGNYIVNGVCVQSRSPYSQITPLPKEFYFNQSLYTGERVWDTYDSELQLVIDKLNH